MNVFTLCAKKLSYGSKSPSASRRDDMAIRHTKTNAGLIGWRCTCGASHRIEVLRGKTDDDLEIEREKSFKTHVDTARAAGG